MPQRSAGLAIEFKSSRLKRLWGALVVLDNNEYSLIGLNFALLGILPDDETAICSEIIMQSPFMC